MLYSMISTFASEKFETYMFDGCTITCISLCRARLTCFYLLLKLVHTHKGWDTLAGIISRKLHL